MGDIPLSPITGGGVCIADAALQTADIIVSAGTGAVSRGIMVGTESEVSHAALYAGRGNVIEAVGEGVREIALASSLKDHYLAVAYRVNGINPISAQKIVNIARKWVQEKRKYDTPGALGAGARNPYVCVFVFGIIACTLAREGEFKSSDKFYCSQLVLEAYRRAGASFIDQNPNLSQPQDMVTAYSHGRLMYVGHLIAGKDDATSYQN